MITVRMSEAIELDASVQQEAASAAPGAPGGATASETPPTLSPSDGRAGSHVPAPARTLTDPRWNLDPSKTFVPENFLVLPDSLRLEAVQSGGWIDPLGPSTTRINATEIDLSPAEAAARRAPAGFGTITNWSKFMTQPYILQMQAAMDMNSRAAGGMAAALLAAKVTDLVVLDALEPDTEAADYGGPRAHASLPRKLALDAPPLAGNGAGHPVGLSRANPASYALTDNVSHNFAGASDHWIRTEPGKPVVPKAGLSNWPMHVELRAADGTQHRHELRTHALNLNAPNWIDQLLYSLNVRWFDTGKQPLTLALLCKDGATSSGVVATALHGMECLEAFNRNEIHLKDADDLARRLDEFLRKGQSLRSPSFAQVADQPLDTARMARDIWAAWERRHGNPASAAMMTLRSRSREAAASDIDTSVRQGARRPTTLSLHSTTAPKHDSRSFGRLLSSESEDSGLFSASTAHSQRASTEFDFPADGQVGETDTDSIDGARVNDPIATPAKGQAPTLEAGSEENSPGTTTATTPAGAPDPSPATSKHAGRLTLKEQMKHAMQHGVELPRDDDRPARRLYPSASMTPALFRELTGARSPISASAATAASTAEASAASGAPAAKLASPSSVGSSVRSPDARPSLSPVQQALALFKTREAAATATPADLEAIPSEVRQEWQPGGRSYQYFRDQLNGLVDRMTSDTGGWGFVWSWIGDANKRDLEGQMGWAEELAQLVHHDMTAAAQRQAGGLASPLPQADESQVALLVRDTIKSLLAERFAGLTLQQQFNWRERVTSGRSVRFEMALAASRTRVDDLPGRLNPSGQLLDKPVPSDGSLPAPIFPLRRPDLQQGADRTQAQRGLKDASDLREMVDKAWARRWVLELAKEVPTAGR